MATENFKHPKKPVRPSRKLRRYGATIYAKVALECSGRAIRVLEHAPDIQVISYGEPEEEPGISTIVMRSLEFPRFWEGTEVDIYGDSQKGVVVLQHPAGADKLFEEEEEDDDEEEKNPSVDEEEDF